MSRLISHPFIKGRQLVDGVVVLNEVMDFETAYDYDNWGFLDYTLSKFDDMRGSWIRANVFSQSLMRCLIPFVEVNIKRGVKQGVILIQISPSW